MISKRPRATLPPTRHCAGWRRPARPRDGCGRLIARAGIREASIRVAVVLRPGVEARLR